MLKLFNHFNLRRHNSFGLDVYAKYFLEYTTEEDLLKFMKDNYQLIENQPFLILGSGSNMLFMSNFEGIILHSLIDKLEIVEEDENSILLKVGSGIIWDHFVEFAVNNDYKGIENLSLVPGSVGASAVQNIGAYGVEAKDIIESVDCIDLFENQKITFSNKECEFEYRNSIFKKKKQLVITCVNYRLLKNERDVNLLYGNLSDKLSHITNPTIKDVREVIIEIRESKLPDHNKIGNAGSFFKNPVISLKKYDELKERFPDIVAFPYIHQRMKLAAGWLIENCGWKGKTIGNVGVYDKQALVIINTGKATGTEISNFANQIIASVEEKFGVRLEPEVIFV